MEDFTMRIEGLDQLVNRFEKAKVNFHPILEQAMQKSTGMIQQTIRRTITEKGITFQGSLRRSVSVVEVSWSRGVVGVGEKYGLQVEKGRKPGSMPPVKPIERWASLKLGAPGAGYVIARKIKEQGTKAQPFVEPSYRDAAPKVLGYFKNGVEVIVQMMARG